MIIKTADGQQTEQVAAGSSTGTTKQLDTSISPSSAVQWEKAPLQLTRRSVFLDIFGPTGVGRTTFALTAPGPIALIHAAEKLDGIVQPVAQRLRAEGKRFEMINFGGTFAGSQKDVSNEAIKKWVLFKSAWHDAFTWARTIIVDTDTEAYQLIRLAFFGGLKPTSGRTDSNYGPVNGEWNNVFKYARQPENQARCNVILIGMATDEYTHPKSGMGERTGRTIRSGHKTVPYMADVGLKLDKADGVFTSTIIKGWYSAWAEGTVLEDEVSTFSNVMALITGTDAEEWER